MPSSVSSRCENIKPRKSFSQSVCAGGQGRGTQLHPWACKWSRDSNQKHESWCQRGMHLHPYYQSKVRFEMRISIHQHSFHPLSTLLILVLIKIEDYLTFKLPTPAPGQGAPVSFISSQMASWQSSENFSSMQLRRSSGIPGTSWKQSWMERNICHLHTTGMTPTAFFATD